MEINSTRSASSLMRIEALQSAEVIARQFQQNGELVEQLGRALVEKSPTRIATIARGSSDHAADFLGYQVMAQTGVWATSLPMSLLTLENAPLHTDGLVSIAISQSGRSPDLILPTQYFSQRNAITIALVNAVESPLAKAAHWVIPLHAGAEQSVAATKSFIAQLFSSVHLLAEWTQDGVTLKALEHLPDQLTAAAQLNWDSLIEPLQKADRLLILGRGVGLSMAKEAALKLKETCGIQAEAFSGAEVQHGPMALVESGYPIVVFAPAGPGQLGLVKVAQEMRLRGARVWLVATPEHRPDLPIVPCVTPALEAIGLIQTFYPMVEALARARGLNPDVPNHLSKVTLTQ